MESNKSYRILLALLLAALVLRSKLQTQVA